MTECSKLLYLWSLIWDEGVMTSTVWEKHWHCSCFILKSKYESCRKSLACNSVTLRRKLVRKYLSDKSFLIDKAQTMAPLNSGSCVASWLHTQVKHLITWAMAVGSLCELTCILAFGSNCISSSQNLSSNYRIINYFPCHRMFYQSTFRCLTNISQRGLLMR